MWFKILEMNTYDLSYTHNMFKFQVYKKNVNKIVGRQNNSSLK